MIRIRAIDLKKKKKKVLYERFPRAESPLIGSKEMGSSSREVQIPETEVDSNNIMKHNTDRRGDLEVEDDGPY